MRSLIDGGQWEEARAELESRPGTLAEQFEVPRNQQTVHWEGVLAALEGRNEDARAALDWLVSESRGSCNFRSWRAEIHLILGEVDSVFPLLTQEVRNRCFLTVGRLVTDTWSPLHGDARWAELLDLAGITPQLELPRR